MTRRELFQNDGGNFGISPAQLEAHEADLEARRPFQNLRFQRIDRQGRIRYVSVSGRPVFAPDGRFRGYRGTGRDITAEVAAEIDLGLRVEERTAELRKAQSELVRREKLSTLGQLTATVAHELRNPLSAIRNTIFAIKETTARAGIELERPLSRVERNITRCDRIISDLLDFTRMRELNCAPLDVNQWLDEVLNDQRLPDGVTLRRDFAKGAILSNFDSERMRRVVVNLVENAAQAMGEDESRSRAITVTTRLDAGTLEIAVIDTGSGIPADILGKVWEPLFSTKSFGTGLGLPTVKQIVEQHGGSVAISSEPGRGTEVAVRLPIMIDKEMAA
jgi:signal transduction histidine kinase